MIVRLLVERQDFDPDSKNEYGRMPPLSVAEQGHDAVVKLLVEREDVVTGYLCVCRLMTVILSDLECKKYLELQSIYSNLSVVKPRIDCFPASNSYLSLGY